MFRQIRHIKNYITKLHWWYLAWSKCSINHTWFPCNGQWSWKDRVFNLLTHIGQLLLLGPSFHYRPQRSCEGYVFTPVCQSFCSRGGGCAIPACIAGGIPAWLQGGLLLGGGLLPGGTCSGGGACLETPLKADGYCCGRYASYWNAFLFEAVAALNQGPSFALQLHTVDISNDSW